MSFQSFLCSCLHFMIPSCHRVLVTFDLGCGLLVFCDALGAPVQFLRGVEPVGRGYPTRLQTDKATMRTIDSWVFGSLCRPLYSEGYIGNFGKSRSSQSQKDTVCISIQSKTWSENRLLLKKKVDHNIASSNNIWGHKKTRNVMPNIKCNLSFSSL